MSAEMLRRAAALMRERAEAASDGVNWWGVEPMTRALDAMFSPPTAEEDAEHIASWHPAVALAVADWLTSVVDDLNVDFNLINSEGYCALTVARAYLGETA